MFRNFFMVSIRHMIRERSYVMINITGLGMGLFCSILIGLFVRYELSYDRFYDKSDRIYRAYLEGKLGETEIKGAWTCPPLGPVFLEEFPEVIDQVRINTWSETVVKYENTGFIEKNFGEADSGFFKVFSIPLLAGDPDRVLASVYNIVLSESTAEKIFGNEDPLGKQLKVGTDTSFYTVTGIMADMPDNSHMKLTAVGSFMSNRRSRETSWTSNSFATYLLLEPGADIDMLHNKIVETVNLRVGPELEEFMGVTIEEFIESGNSYGYKLQPLTDIHLDPTIQHDMKPSNDRRYIYIFSLAGLIILIMAGINYTNLATARSAGRSLETGIRKISGADKGSLVVQFLLESFMMAFIALVFALIMLEMLLPRINSVLGLNLWIDYTGNWYTIPSMLLLVIIMGLISGTYPAVYLASFNPLQIITRSSKSGTKGGFLRNLLVAIQLTASVLLVFSSILIYRQVSYMLNRDLGYDKENTLVIRRAGALGGQTETFLQELGQLSGVQGASHSTSVPNYPNNHNAYRMQGETSDRSFLLQTNWVDYDYIDTWGIEISEGRFFSRDYGTDSSACVINMSAVRQFGLEEPLNHTFLRPSGNNEWQSLRVIGVVDDFHYQSLHERIYPYIFILKDPVTRWGFISVRMDTDNTQQTLREIESLWNRFTANDPMVWFFMEEDFNNLYMEDKRTGILAGMFAILTIVIGSLGLFGLASFTTRSRTKEIGIRKVNGAGTFDIMVLLYKNISVLIGISTLLAWIAGYYFTTRWLQSFYFSTDLSAWEFAGSLICVSVVSVLTISWQSYRAASTNPAETLKYE